MLNTIQYFYDSHQQTMAMLIRNEHTENGIHFLTENSAYQQVAFMGHPQNHVIQPHFHNKIERIVEYTCETLIIKKGLMEVTLYENQKANNTFTVKTGDILILFSGGHGFKMLEATEMVEIKQGPFLGDKDKTRF